MSYHFSSIKKLCGELELPGDKSISHRAVIFSSLSKGKSRIKNLSTSADVQSSIECFRQLGASALAAEDLIIDGCGFKGFNAPVAKLDAGNSGTTARLLSGILAAQNFPSEIIGDDSLSRRPMKRIIEPLKLMGASIFYSDIYTLPLKFFPSSKLNAVKYKMPVASAQVKSAILLAGLHLEETTEVIETSLTRDHTERMLKLPVEEKDGKRIIKSSYENYPRPDDYFVPSDFSSAAFFIAAALLIPNSEVLIKNVLLNESRTGLLKILSEMGGDISIENVRYSSGEKFGNIIVRSSNLRNIEIEQNIIPNIIDEVPILSVCAAFAEGEFKLQGARELRYKESDRISAICYNLKLAGLKVEEFEDGFSISGVAAEPKQIFKSFGDHRIAMAFAVLSSVFSNGGRIDEIDCIKISNPGFLNQLNSLSS